MDRPSAGMTTLLAIWTEKLAGGPQVGRSESLPLTRIKGVCKSVDDKVWKGTCAREYWWLAECYCICYLNALYMEKQEKDRYGYNMVWINMRF